jgi:vacuolar-type H+-ATPase subunit I/STV1
MYYVGDVWIPKIAYSNLLNKLNELTNLPVFRDSDKQNFEPKVRTYFKMDDFVYPFQTIVNTYGIPRYKEVNILFSCYNYIIYINIYNFKDKELILDFLLL